MITCEHDGGFSLDTSVRIEAHDRQGRERLLRYSARPAFPQKRLRQLDPEHRVYKSKKPGPGGKVSVLLTPAPNARPALGADTAPATTTASLLRRTRIELSIPASGDGVGRRGISRNEGKGKAETKTEETPFRQAARYVCALLLARIYEVFPLIYPKCGGMMKIITFMARGHPIDEGEAVREILAHLDEPVDLPRIAPAHGPSLWEAAGQDGDNLLIQPLPVFRFDQRIAW